MLKRLSLLFTVFFIALAAMAQDAAIKEMSQAAQQLKTMTCDFRQTKHLRMLRNRQMVSEGHMAYSQPDKLLWEYTAPYTYTFVLNGDKVMLRNDKHTDVIDAAQHKVFREIARIMLGSVTGNFDENTFRAEVTSTERELMAKLTPQRRELREIFSLVTIHYDRQQRVITQIELTEKNQDRTVIELLNIKQGETLPASLFKID